MTEQQKKELAERQVRLKEDALLFQGLFDKGDGKAVLKILSVMCNENEPTFVDQNPTGTAYKEGQRSIIIGIRKQMNKTFNQPKQEKAKVKEIR